MSRAGYIDAHGLSHSLFATTWFYGWGSQDAERLRKLLKVTQLIKGGGWIQTHILRFNYHPKAGKMPLFMLELDWQLHITFCLFFWLCHEACRILVPQPRMKLAPPAVEVQTLNHWSTREVLTKSKRTWPRAKRFTETLKKVTAVGTPWWSSGENSPFSLPWPRF